MSPKNAPALQKMTECHSSLIFMKRIANEAHTIPKRIKGIWFCKQLYNKKALKNNKENCSWYDIVIQSTIDIKTEFGKSNIGYFCPSFPFPVKLHDTLCKEIYRRITDATSSD